MLDLKRIKKKAEAAKWRKERGLKAESVWFDTIPALLAEIERLQTENGQTCKAINEQDSLLSHGAKNYPKRTNEGVQKLQLASIC